MKLEKIIVSFSLTDEKLLLYDIKVQKEVYY